MFTRRLTFSIGKSSRKKLMSKSFSFSQLTYLPLYEDLKMKPLSLFLVLILVLGAAFLISCSRSNEPKQAEAELEALLLKTVTKDETLRNAVRWWSPLSLESIKPGLQASPMSTAVRP